MAGAASAHQAATATREDTSQQRAGRTRRTSADPQRAQQGATASPAAALAALDSLSRLQQLADASPRVAQLQRLQALADASPQVAQLQRLQALADASPQVAQLRRLQALADRHYSPMSQLAGAPEEEELVQGQFANAELQPQLQQAPRANNTGLPDQLKSGIESLSGLSMDHVRVHYNSSQPAQLNALAYAQGSDIHVAPGQERHLPHEAWHVVQQAQGRVRPTLQLKDGVPANDDVGLELEADVMGGRALDRGNRCEETHRSIFTPIETAQKTEGGTTNSPYLSVASNHSAPLANGRYSAQLGGNEVQRITDQRPEAALQRQVQAWGDESERVEQLLAWQGVADGRGVGGKRQDLTPNFLDEMGARALSQDPSAGVQQQRPATPVARTAPQPHAPTVQRAVGFELQLRHWELLRDYPAKGRSVQATVVDNGKGHALESGEGWSMESDGGEPEFILRHVDETNTAAATKSAVAALKKAMRIASAVNKNGSWTKDKTYRKPREALKIEPKGGAPEKPVTADVQITGGFRFERLATLLSQLSQRDPTGKALSTKANGQLMQNDAAKHYSGDDLLLGKALVSVGKALNAHFPSFDDQMLATAWTDDVKNDAHGILTLLGSYLFKAKQLGHAYIKDFPLLSKSNLATVVAASPLVNNTWAPHQRTLIEVLLEASGRGADELLYPSLNPANNMKEDGPKVGDWLNGLFAGTDLLSHLDNRSFADNSMGNLKRLDQPRGAPAPILELRRINNNMPIDEWELFVKQAIDWVARMNELEQDNLDF
jgi:hypothetical protein